MKMLPTLKTLGDFWYQQLGRRQALTIPCCKHTERVDKNPTNIPLKASGAGRKRGQGEGQDLDPEEKWISHKQEGSSWKPRRWGGLGWAWGRPALRRVGLGSRCCCRGQWESHGPVQTPAEMETPRRGETELQTDNRQTTRETEHAPQSAATSPGERPTPTDVDPSVWPASCRSRWREVRWQPVRLHPDGSATDRVQSQSCSQLSAGQGTQVHARPLWDLGSRLLVGLPDPLACL